MSAEGENERPAPPPRDPRQPADFDPQALGRDLLRQARIASLGTMEASSGFPMVTLTSMATDYDGTPLILVSRLSHHTQNLLADPRGSLLISRGGKGDPLAHPRLTLRVLAEQAEAPHLRARFLARHPKAQIYVDFPDFLFFRLRPEMMHLNGGFARAYSGEAGLILAPVAEPAAFAELEQSALDHLNDDHRDALALYATRLCHQPPAAWRAVGLDPDGLDLMAGDQTARLTFGKMINNAKDLRERLVELAAMARAEPQQTG
jgi:putative heme iron utilization protein